MDHPGVVPRLVPGDIGFLLQHRHRHARQRQLARHGKPDNASSDDPTLDSVTRRPLPSQPASIIWNEARLRPGHPWLYRANRRVRWLFRRCWPRPSGNIVTLATRSSAH